jgi:RNA polymerase sigma factor (sigma-70 family)
LLINEAELIERALSGSKNALEELLIRIQDMVFNLSLRMLGTIVDAEDASQEIMIKIITHLASFRKESTFSTWVYRISVNYLLNYKKSIFVKQPLSFDYYGEDIQKGFTVNTMDLLQNVDEGILAEELKLSCTNVMLQCLDDESRCIYVMGTMFKVDSKVSAEILGLSPEAYRQRLSRIRKKMANFLSSYCGLVGGTCNCQKRVGHAIANHRLNPTNLEYFELQKLNNTRLLDCMEAMEKIDTQSLFFAEMPKYRSPQKAKDFLIRFIESNEMHMLQG